jgi:hypothetical protein
MFIACLLANNDSIYLNHILHVPIAAEIAAVEVAGVIN